CFGNTCAGVIKKKQECVIAQAFFGAAVRSSKDRIHFGLIQVGDLVPSESFERHRPYLAAPRNMFGASFSDESRYRVNGSEPLVACTDRASSVLFEIIEKTSKRFAGQVE